MTLDEAGFTSAVIDDAAVDDGLADDLAAEEDAFACSSYAGTRPAMVTTTTE